MPELPEVTALAADLDRRLSGRVVDRLVIMSFAALKTFDPPVDAIRGLTIGGVTKHGKYLDIKIGELHLIIHLARAGWVRWREAAPTGTGRPGKGPIAARFVLNDGSGFDVTEAGTKKSLAIWLVRNPADVPGIARLGPDPLGPDFTIEVFRQILKSAGRAQIKGLLRYQSNIAGIGNAYSDEILHVAKMSPFKPAAMSDEESVLLYDAIRSTLTAAIERADGLAASELKHEKKSNLRVHARAGEACPVCGDVIRQVKFADSTLEYCATCQTGGKPLADRVLSRLLK